MTRLFERGELRLFLQGLLEDAAGRIDKLPEHEVLSRSTGDLLDQFSRLATVEAPTITEGPVDGGVSETSSKVRDQWGRDRTYTVRGFTISATFDFTGDARLFYYRPNTHLMKRFEASLGAGSITVRSGQTASDIGPEKAKAAIDGAIGPIRTELEHVRADVDAHNSQVAERLRPVIDRRKKLLQERRNLAGALGFSIAKRPDAPRPVPLSRKQVGAARTNRSMPPYADEPALTAEQYEDVIRVVQSTLLAMERTPSVASGKGEEELRDQILVQLNGTFEGGATGETFVQSGKTDILVQDGERHVFVGECKWWTGAKECGKAIDQLLGYLPWRDEKAALILFIDRKNASAVLEKAEQSVREHPAFKRVGTASTEPAARRNYILGHPDDPDREIRLAVLFAVLPEGA
ncbi:hypothetical protein HMPREF0063_11126 [Aeromicrobium marinum DSM 15272]|uniref:Uncharacterized protein n=1 Tax=Aeromicrobium marinum DSM 15272 TaxID=585531 RepID=E2SAR8_9ACTN|nr:hypothetical protein [Aeromicrobium marinum]EFQ83464.1 hypothetical protein HMPREF0063_11126 [Aeromicrobium marinum DSM 15272]